MHSLFNRFPAAWVDSSLSRLLLAFAITLVFTVLARALRGVNFSGAIAGSIVCLILLLASGPAAFVALACVFGLAWLSTRLGYSRKQRLGTAERREGRKASQVLANLGVATVCAAIYAWRGQPIFLVAFAAALTEPAADTVSSEVGQAYSATARLITTGRSVPAGTNGGVTLAGSLAGAAGALAVALVCVTGELISWRAVGITTVAGILGMFADSYLGAVFEGRSLNNDMVNFLASVGGALCAWALLRYSGYMFL